MKHSMPHDDINNLAMSESARPLLEKVAAHVRDHCDPAYEEYERLGATRADRWGYAPGQLEILDDLKKKAKQSGLWNFFLPNAETGEGLSNLDYAYIAFELGKNPIASQTLNCSAPDTGNMEVLERVGTAEQKEKWLKPLLAGEIRSAFAMTEPDVASSDAGNIAMRCVADGDDYVLDGEKWWSSGAGDPRCEIYIVMAKTAGDNAPKHQRHSMLLVPAATPGIEVLRAMTVFGDDDAPHGHMHIRFTGVRVPKSAMILGEGRGFEIAQGRLGPGRIHHCMRAIGQAEAALELMCRRALGREAFGRKLAELGANYDIIADCRAEIEMARLLCLKAAFMMDQGDMRAAAPWISQIKVVAPKVALKVCDEAIQMHGAGGISQDQPLARLWTHLRTLRLVDGPDAVHRRPVARGELRKYTNERV